MTNRIVATLLVLCVLPMPTFAGETNWTAKVKWVIARDSGAVEVTIDNPNSPNPSTAEFDCNANIVHLASLTQAPPAAMTSVALAAKTTGDDIRIGIDGSGTDCVADYIVIR